MRLQHGEEFIKEGGADAGGGGGMSDIFDMLSGQGRRKQQGPRKSEDTVQRLAVSLKDFYLGTSKCAATSSGHVGESADCHCNNPVVLFQSLMQAASALRTSASACVHESL
jgi:DnaJ-class molecular chaperone